MTFKELKQQANEFYPALLLERFSTHEGRHKVRRAVFYVLVLIATVVFILPLLQRFGVVDISFFNFISENIFKIRGLLFVVFSFWLAFYMYESMYFHFYFKEGKLDFEVAKIVTKSKKDDITKSFLNSRIGERLMVRLGIGIPEIVSFLKERKTTVTDDEYEIFVDDGTKSISLADYGRSIIHFDNEFASFLKKNGITADIFKEALNWVSRNQRLIRDKERWWSKDRLSRIPSIGRNWSFGKIYLLERYGHSIFEENSYIHLGDKFRVYRPEVYKLENVLVKKRGANTMIVSENIETGINIVSSFAKELLQGTVLPELENKRVYVLDSEALINAMRDKSNFEIEFKNILVQSSNAGNVILVIPSIASFIESAHALNVNVADLLSEALNSSSLQVVAVSNSKRFHKTIETNRELMQHFEKISIVNLNNNAIIELVQDEVHIIETNSPIIFTYPAVVEAVKSADRYFSDGILLDKAFDLLHEITPRLISSGKTLVKKEDILELVQLKTGIPQGVVGDEEHSKLQNLENTLHQRVVGQEDGIRAICTALRRARAGVGNPRKPLGSFLFLGPTGVGKTETTKALAEGFFNDEDNIIRLDMSEFNTENSLEKLIGSFRTEKPGVLATKIRENQYGVLLLDEFEKTQEEVHDLFLQILDEGKFTDGRGEEINARNLIIIATSNAGSDLIYEETLSGRLGGLNKDTVITEIIRRGIFKPELINRFDDVIVFHALRGDHLKKIAKLMLEKLNKRLEEKGINIKITEQLLNYLVEMGSNPEFGARAMNRAIQNRIESLIAEGIINKEISSGDTVEITNDTNTGDLKIIKR